MNVAGTTAYKWGVRLENDVVDGWTELEQSKMKSNNYFENIAETREYPYSKV